MILPLSYHEIYDKELIEWLNRKRNRSSFIRDVLYREMKNEGHVQEIKNKGNENMDLSISNSTIKEKYIEEDNTEIPINNKSEEGFNNNCEDVDDDIVDSFINSLNSGGF